MNNADKKKWLTDQIKLRIIVFRELVSNELCIDNVPETLATARIWEAPQQGIEAIRSTSSFVTTHPQNGTLVRELRSLIKSYKARGENSVNLKTPTQEINRLKLDISNLKEILQATANQFVEMQFEKSLLEDQLTLSEHKEAGYEREIKELKANKLLLKKKNITLQEKVLRQDNPVTSIDFRK